ncbi:MAG: trans-4-hydroxy-L-proline dehydratase [Synergistota bacterium]|nr:trans-4-hydroxy-L-proline dehydratase [Synergistota bacterium]
MKERIERLRTESFEAPVVLDHERAEIITDFYEKNFGKHSIPMTRALAFRALCEKKSIYIGNDELIVGERGPFPKSVSTYPELTCHSMEDLEILDTREKNPYGVSEKCREVYREKVIPYWRGRTMRDKIFHDIGDEWKETYAAGIFTEFMEQRAPGHTTLDGKFYGKGIEDFRAEIAESIAGLDFLSDPEATEKREQLRAMDMACDAVVLFADRHADLAEKMASEESDPARKKELERIAANCRYVPRKAPRDFWEALQMYWFMHLGTITELNGWDAMNPGHLDRYFYPFYKKELDAETITPEWAKELLSAFWIKFNNHPAPPKVGVTAAESGTYNDFTNINLGGLLPDGIDGVNDISYMMLEVLDEIHLLQPQANIQLSRKNPDRFLKAACRVVRKGYGYPSIFNADTVIEQMIRAGKTVEDAREGGTSGCVETGAFGKEAYILTGYFNTPKVFEITLNNGVDPMTGKKIGVETGDPAGFKTFDELYEAFARQLRHFVEIKVRGNQFIERMYADYAPAVFLSVLTDDCIKKGRDYNNGGPRYNTNYIQCVGIGTITDSMSVLKKHVFEDKTFTMQQVLGAAADDFEGHEAMKLTFANKTPLWGNDDDYADDIMKRVFISLYDEIDGRPNTKGGEYHIDMLPTTCHIYFGSITGATPNGRRARTPLSEGISPSQGADVNGPTAIIKSCGKMDQIRTGGTLLNMRIMPKVIADEEGIDKLARLIRTYFRFDAHHIQFNVVDTETLRDAQANPDKHRDLIVRVAGYSDYFCDIGPDLQEEIISRTTQDEI